ncbi:uncharacterized protein LACBIDRAFT_309620 [Laccaria bicolor S238N-H82]|uniref:Predicted protein n=1 Tax=Laccaria bicolor (strain S238N-H82 / ATCC MYA-4686) TaxID=486041 RepID=B0DSP4_LACBS|nr:uncharacterized protein LACBIDRAFT_309620 [Laccaria bicolor S238N-H82]EDR02270.1 predicted protein [Laccaria bicolor S238N-H82]|eukprot:XP_001886947.1 predicted protein [Laccaria bicolor S238N-H82]
MHFLDLPPELIDEILLTFDPFDVARLSQTCRSFRSHIYNDDRDDALWGGLYLSQQYDDPRLCLTQDGRERPKVDWRRELQRILRARSVMIDSSLCKPNELGKVLQTLIDMISFVPPISSSGGSEDTLSNLNWTYTPGFEEISSNLVWVAAMLRQGFLDDVKTRPGLTDREKQLLAKLHTYYGLTNGDTTRKSRVASWAYVYNMRNYRWDNDFGPFTNEGVRGGVNWEHMQAIHHVMSRHLVTLDEGETVEYAIYKMSMPYTQISIPRGLDLAKEKDWAGIKGLWKVSFCFVDHRDLNAFNDPPNSGIDTSIFESDDFVEIFRTMDVDLEVAHTEHDPEHPDRPVIIFFGKMRDPSTSTMSGRIEMTPDNQVHWSSVSGDSGNAIWSLEGIQVGGLRSAYGVLGSWTTIYHDEDDPVGPFWLRKAEDDEGVVIVT